MDNKRTRSTRGQIFVVMVSGNGPTVPSPQAKQTKITANSSSFGNEITALRHPVDISAEFYVSVDPRTGQCQPGVPGAEFVAALFHDQRCILLPAK